ncbi:hypothetical protein ACOART_12015, partial [Glaesserella parasuis]|uniref:hypothetical protein n=1 Tax=Glaesserella parasuis TaxID=738 RepID=UPI003B771B5C
MGNEAGAELDQKHHRVDGEDHHQHAVRWLALSARAASSAPLLVQHSSMSSLLGRGFALFFTCDRHPDGTGNGL